MLKLMERTVFHQREQLYRNVSSFTRKNSNGDRSGSSDENKLLNTLKKNFPQADSVVVEDISGGCGSMYVVQVVSEDFRGKSRVEQHQLVNEVLKEEIKTMHGIRISTSIPKHS